MNVYWFHMLVYCQHKVCLRFHKTISTSAMTNKNNNQFNMFSAKCLLAILYQFHQLYLIWNLLQDYFHLTRLVLKTLAKMKRSIFFRIIHSYFSLKPQPRFGLWSPCHLSPYHSFNSLFQELFPEISTSLVLIWATQEILETLEP